MQSPIAMIGGVLCLHFFMLIQYQLYGQDKDSVAKQSILFPASVQELLVIQPTTEATKVTTATKVAQNIFEAPNIINSYKRRELIDYGFFSFNQLLWLQPNFSMSKDYDRMTVSARGVYEGWNNNHLLVLIDGVPINENIYGSALTWEITPLVFTKLIEVMRGGGSALYGTNAMNGLLSIQTVSPADLKGNVEARSRISSNGTQIYDAIAGINNEKLSLVASFNHFFTHGLQATSYDASGRTSSNGKLQQFALQDRRQSNYFFAKADFKGKFTGLSFQYHEQNWSFGTGHGWLFQVPDQPENMNEGRRIVSFSYTNPNKGRPFNYEAVLRYQSKSIDWNMRFFPNKANYLGIDYPNGVTEVVKTSMDDIFLRGQLSYTFKNKALLLGGIENSIFLYNGDAIHSSNIRLNGDFTPFPDNQMLPVGNYLDYMTSKPLVNVGAFVQFISPKFLREKLTITAGLRFDNQFLNYTDITQSTRPTESKSFAKFSPRLSLVFQATENLYLKAIAGRGFRTPAPAEMFGANTFALASNIRQLQPETVDTYELVADWNINKQLQLRVNGFYTDFDNIIAYSVQNNNLSTNLYSLHNAGVEIETKWNWGNFSGFANYGFTKRLEESIVDTTISVSKELTWVPAHTAKLAACYKFGKFYASTVLHYQGEVLRRNSDVTPATALYRNATVPAFVAMDMKIGYIPNKFLEFAVYSNNLLDNSLTMIKNFAYPFDYRGMGRQIMFDVKFTY